MWSEFYVPVSDTHISLNHWTWHKRMPRNRRISFPRDALNLHAVVWLSETAALKVCIGLFIYLFAFVVFSYWVTIWFWFHANYFAFNVAGSYWIISHAKSLKLNNVDKQQKLSLGMLLKFGFHVTYWAIKCKTGVSLWKSCSERIVLKTGGGEV